LVHRVYVAVRPSGSRVAVQNLGSLVFLGTYLLNFEVNFWASDYLWSEALVRWWFLNKTCP